MSYAEHGPRIFLAGRPNNNHSAPLTYGDYVLPRKRSEGRLKLYDSCSDIRAWSPNPLESSRYFRELNEHARAPRKIVPFDVVMESMIGLTAQAQNELRIVQRELQRYKSLKFTPEQRKYLEESLATAENAELEETKIEPIIRPLSQEMYLNARKLASSSRSDMYLSVYFQPDKRYQHDKELRSTLLTNARVLRENLNALSENDTYVVSRVTSCNILTEAPRERNERANACVEYVDASSQVMRETREAAMQTDGYKNDESYDGRLNANSSSSSQYYETSESGSESELAVNPNPDVCDKSHKRAIIQKDSEIIVLKNELGMREDELEELRELNGHLQRLSQEKDKNASVLRRNLNSLQERLNAMDDKRNNEVEDLNAKLSASVCLVDQLKAELSRKYQMYHLQSQEIQKLRTQVKEAELLSIENESLTRKAKEMERLSREAESCGIALEQVKSVWRERDMLQRQYREQSCTLADREDEINRLLTLIKEMSVTADSREVEMNDVVAGMENEIRAKSDKISRCEMQLICMEREIGNLTSMLKSSLNNLDESKIAYEGICEYTKCEHDACLDIQRTLSNLKAFIAELEESKLERHNRLREIDNLKACVACYSREAVSEITSTDFDTGQESIQPAAEGASTSSNCDDCYSSKELVNVQVQSDEVETTITTCSQESEKMELNEAISYEEIDRALAIHIKHSIDKIHEMFAFLQGAGDQHVQIMRECTRQREDLQKKELEIAGLKHTLRRGEGDCAMQEELRKRMLEKEKALEDVISKRNSDIECLSENFRALEQEVAAYRAERDTLKSENADLISAKELFSKENEVRSDELRAQTDQIRRLIQQTNDLKRTIDILKEKTHDIDEMRNRLTELQMKNNDLTNKLIQANELVLMNNELITDLRAKDEKNKLTLTHKSIEYDSMITQKHSDIVKLKDENQSLRDQLIDVEIQLAKTNDTLSLLRNEGDSGTVALDALQANLSGLDRDREELLARMDSLRTEMASCRNSTTHIECELQTLSRKNEALKVDIETVKSTNDRLLLAYDEDDVKPALKDTLRKLPDKIYERIARLLREAQTEDNETGDTPEGSRRNEIISATGDETENQRTKTHAGREGEEFCAWQRESGSRLDSVVREVDRNVDNVARKLRSVERQHEEKLQEIKRLMSDAQSRDREIKKLQEYVTYLLQEKQDLQRKLEHQADDYKNKLTLLKRKYDGSLNAFRKRYKENVEQLQARFDDIMRTEKGPFDAESWLRSLNPKELAELCNRINILSSYAVTNDEGSDVARAEGERPRDRRNNHEEHRLYSKFTLRENADRRVSTCEIVDGGNKTGETAVAELYSLRQKREHRSRSDDDGVHRSNESESLRSKIDRILDRQREKFIYQCSMHHRSNNAR